MHGSRRSLALVLGLGATVAVAACGGGSSESPTAPVTTSPCSAAEPALARTTSPGGTSAGGFAHGAFCREYLVHVPPSYDGTRPFPLVVALHGYTGTPTNLESGSGLSRTADERDFIVVYPAGLQNAWDMTPGGRDSGFLRELVGRLQARGNIDRSRIYVTGFSMGGGMANRAACDLGDVFAAAAPISGSYQWYNQCDARRPIPILSVHGSADTVVPPVASTGFSIADVWLQGWAQRNGCSPQPVVTEHGGVVETSYRGCPANADVRLLMVSGLGHSWWAPTNDEMADFFAAHPFPR